MKKALIALLLLGAVGCGPAKRDETNSPSIIPVSWNGKGGTICQEDFYIVEIDSCEYLISYYDRSMTITHKGNCKNH